MGIKQTAKLVLAVIAFIAMSTSLVSAQSSSPNYKVDETQFGSGGGVNDCSTSYCANTSVGGVGVGTTSSTNYSAAAGFIKPEEEFLEFVVSTSSVDLGTLSTGSTSTGQASFYVRAYLNSSYTVVTRGNPPTNSGHALVAKSTQALPVIGTEEFGINVVANTQPTTFGANPAPQPNSTFANGQAAPGYELTNQFKYAVGDTVARTTTTSQGRTDYTMSYIADVSTITPGGKYVMNQDLIVVATY